ncbi:MAG TPA: sugar-binding protein [bacterium]|nr:sugar-binding protein [bacterium]HPN33075.1 sugar-binding protein [bacterium]
MHLLRPLSLFLSGMLLSLGCSKPPASLRYVVVPKALTNPYWFQVEDGMKAAGEKLGVRVEMIGPAQASDVTAQVQILESLIASRVSGLAVSPNDPDGVTSVIDRAVAAGIPVLTFDSDAPKSKRLCYVGTDNYTAGRAAARQLLLYLKPGDAYAILTGSLGALNLNERIRGFRDEIAEQQADLREINLLNCDETTDRALDQMEDLTRATPQLKAWFITGCWATVTPKGAFLNALDQRRDIAVIAFDTVKEELLLVKEGLVQALIGQRPYEMGYRCVEMLHDIVHNQKTPASTTLSTGVDVITAANVDSFLVKPD